MPPASFPEGAICSTRTCTSHRRRLADSLVPMRKSVPTLHLSWRERGSGELTSRVKRQTQARGRSGTQVRHIRRSGKITADDLGDAKRVGAEPATRLLEWATAMFEHWHPFKAGAIDRLELQRLTQTYRPAFEAFCKLGARQKRDRRWRALGVDLLRQWPAVFRFLDDSGVEPTNNAAERGLRGGVLWRLTCQGSRTDEGSHFVQRLMTVAANCKRQGRPVIRFLADALLAWRAGISPPSLLPLAT